MENNKVKKVVFLVFLVIAIGVWGYNLTLFFPKADQFKIAKTNWDIASKASPRTTRKASLDKQAFAYEASFKDPFTPFFLIQKPKPKPVQRQVLPPKPEPPPAFSVNGIVWDKKLPYAVLAGPDGETHVVRKGDVVGDIKISLIEPKQIWFLFKGRKYKLELPG